VADGSGLVWACMYHGLGELWRGLSKSAFGALHYSWAALAAALLGGGALFLGPFVFLTIGLWQGEMSRGWVGLPLLQIVLIWAASLAVARRFRMSQGMAFLRPLTMALTMVIALHSAWCVRWGQGTVWKGRCYRAEEEHLRHDWEQAG
jgi:hypothetical protein